MAKKVVTKKGYGKLLDAWVAPDWAGQALGCVSTTFTFSPSFFEEECLSRFVNLQTDPASDGACYIIEREEKLSQLVCAAVLVDQHHAAGTRSLRWDLISARIPGGGIQHSKVSLLLWENCARLIVASANLTDDGYRRNQEVFGVLDYHTGGETQLGCLRSAIDFLEDIVSYQKPDRSTDPEAPAVKRWHQFLNIATRKTKDWGADEGRRLKTAVHFIPVSPDSKNVFESVNAAWGNWSPPDGAWVTSPFFDSPDAVNEPAQRIWKVLHQRNEAHLNFCVVAEEVPGEKALFIQAPKSIIDTKPKRENAVLKIRRLNIPPSRPLHAKTIWLRSDDRILYLIGSSNFTSAGLGLGRTSNIEANLAYVSLDYKHLFDACLTDEGIDPKLELRFKPIVDDCTDEANDTVLLPFQFVSAVFSDDDGKGLVSFEFTGAPPLLFSIRADDSDVALVSEESWKGLGAPASFSIPWNNPKPPSCLWVTWAGAGGEACWPVNVKSQTDLPPPSELKNLPLDLLVQILTSARPAYRLIGEYLDEKKRSSDDVPVLIDPHKRVDTSTFLLQRTRRISWALSGLRARLEAPAPSEQALHWRLKGPIGVMALAEAIAKEAKNPAERCFLLTELALEISRVVPQQTSTSLKRDVVKMAIKDVIRNIVPSLSEETFEEYSDMKAYMERAFKEALAL